MTNRGLGALVAEKFAVEGSNVAINYVSNKEAADKVASDIASKYNVKTIVIQGVRPTSVILHDWPVDIPFLRFRMQEARKTVSMPSRLQSSNSAAWTL